ncbi:ras guanine nucleotide exchange factor domain-containing protein [Mycena belliarum]|uniref:Ras guanine nucleotide exchange factor domain-containing protein n=1 Tax=Mycena belliarum TaxID=1033014 RepID=A0AAD6UA83_9AGAR|nr:ras guanine nucleotide exchange factor domain-containing protein [Mycena belliae]
MATQTRLARIYILGYWSNALVASLPAMLPLTAAEHERYKKIRKKIRGPVLAVDTDLPESVHSDEPDAPSSPLATGSSITLHGLPIERVFPSLAAPTRMLRRMTHPKQLDQMLTVVSIFRNIIEDIRSSILTPDMFLFLTCVVYKHLDGGISRASARLQSHIQSLAGVEGSPTDMAMLQTVALVELILERLVMLLRAAETFHRLEKPLPDLPQGNPDDSTLPDHYAARVLDLMDGPSPLLNESSPESPISDATLVESPDDVAAGQMGNKHNLIRRLLQMGPDPSKIKPAESALNDEAECSKSQTGLGRFLHSNPKPKRSALSVASPDTSSLASSVNLIPHEYVARQSFIYDCTDPLRPTEKVTMPLPTGDTVEIRLDSKGQVKAATLPALIQLLTSHHDLAISDIRETFFLSFRLFSSSQQVFEAICDRWDESPPCTVNKLSLPQRRVWLQHLHHVRSCLARLLFSWLDEYWRPEDAHVLSELRAFVETRFPLARLDEVFIARVLSAVELAEHHEHTSRLQRVKDVERLGNHIVPALALELRPEDDYTLNLAVFETTDGRERFAGQITALAHQLFRLIDPEDAVAKWLRCTPGLFDVQKFEVKFTNWVVQSILSLENRDERVAMIEFWLDVATICIRLRNFLSAHDIFSGLVSTPVDRLSLTILDVSIPSKQQYQTLSDLFDRSINFTNYRRALAQNDMPTVPLMFVLSKDVARANELPRRFAPNNNPDAPKTLIHLSAFVKLKEVICTMESCLPACSIEPVPAIQEWVQNQLAVPMSSTSQLDAMSKELEGPFHALQKGDAWRMTVSNVDGTPIIHTISEPGAQPVQPKLRKNKSIASLMNLRIRSR